MFHRGSNTYWYDALVCMYDGLFQYASLTHKFTGKERDAATGLDYFGARFDSSSFGRFMSPDPDASWDQHDPQSLSLYSYVENNPTNLVDPDGKLFCRPAKDGEGPAKQICITDTEYINGGDKYKNQGFEHNNCNCDTDADRAAYKKYISGATTDVTTDYFFNFPALVSGVRGAFGLGRLGIRGISRLLGGTAEEAADMATMASLVAYSEMPREGYTHFDCSCDSGADKDAWQHPNGNAGKDYVGYAVVFAASLYIVKHVASYFTEAEEEEEGVVIGKVNRDGTLRDTTLKPGERQLELPNQGSPKANWAQNSSKLREAMRDGTPIRDGSAGVPGSESGFVRAERNLLRDHGWELKGDTWYPPNK